MNGKHTINYEPNDLIEYYTNRLLMDWARTNQPKIVAKIKAAVEKALEDKPKSCQPTKKM